MTDTDPNLTSVCLPNLKKCSRAFWMIEAYGLKAPGLDASAAEAARSSRRAGAAGHGLVPALEGGLLVRYRELQRLGEVHRHQGGNVSR